MPDPWPPLFLHAIYLSPAIAYSIAREPLARVHSWLLSSCRGVRELVSHPRFVRVSRSCSGKPYFGLPRYFNELIVIETLSRSHESFLCARGPLRSSRGSSTKCHAVQREPLPNQPYVGFCRLQWHGPREATSIKNTLPRNFKLARALKPTHVFLARNKFTIVSPRLQVYRYFISYEYYIYIYMILLMEKHLIKFIFRATNGTFTFSATHLLVCRAVLFRG